jgi:vancomycin resistance protein YoaR
VTASSPVVSRRRASARSRLWTRIGIIALVIGIPIVVVPFFFAGSSARLAAGTRVAGVEVGGLSPSAATRLLDRRFAAVAATPVTFAAAGKEFSVTPASFGVTVDWAGAVAAAQRQGGGLGLVRGYRRIALELFPRNVSPAVRIYDPGVDAELATISRAVAVPQHDARLVRRGLHVSIAAGSPGRSLDRVAARALLVEALSSLSRAPVALPVVARQPGATVASLMAAQRTAALMVSAPVTMAVGPTHLRLPRWRIAKMLDLKTLRFSGPVADGYFRRLAKQLDRKPHDATFAVSGQKVRVVPARDGVELDVPRSAARIAAAAQRVDRRAAQLVVAVARPARSTAQAQAMGITGTVAAYETFYGGDPNRIHNVQLVAHLVDGALIAPGATFSFNGTTGERTAAKGFLEAPVIVHGELETGLGGGVCQVSTTVFNAAYEAGLPITARTNHALYISHYPLGRDATVDYPDIDLKFVNDTPHWLLLRTWVGTSSLTVGLYGAPQHRRVDTVAAPLRVVSPPPVEKTVDATLKPGQVVVDDSGVPAQSTSVERKVYSVAGKLLSDQTWYSSYRAEPRIIRVGPKAKPKKEQPADTTTTETTTTDETTTTTTTDPATTAGLRPH